MERTRESRPTNTIDRLLVRWVIPVLRCLPAAVVLPILTLFANPGCLMESYYGVTICGPPDDIEPECQFDEDCVDEFGEGWICDHDHEIDCADPADGTRWWATCVEEDAG